MLTRARLAALALAFALSDGNLARADLAAEKVKPDSHSGEKVKSRWRSTARASCASLRLAAGAR